MVVHAVLQFVPETCRDLFYGLNDLRAVAEHSLAIDMRDVIQIDVNGESSQAEVEEVERGAALQDELALKERMFVKLNEQLT